MEKTIKNRFKKIEKRVDKIENQINRRGLTSGKLLKCHNCDYPWISRTKKLRISCPNCGTKVRVGEPVKKGRPKKKKDNLDKAWDRTPGLNQ